MSSNESITVTVTTRDDGMPVSTLRAEIWLDGVEDRARVTYEKDGRTYELTGSKALVFLTVISRDASDLLAGRPVQEHATGPRRPAGF